MGPLKCLISWAAAEVGLVLKSILVFKLDNVLFNLFMFAVHSRGGHRDLEKKILFSPLDQFGCQVREVA